MKKLLSIALALAAMSVSAQNAGLKTEGKSAKDIVPASWENVHSVVKDINKDGIKDLVVLAMPTNADKMLKREDGFVINMNEPVVAVYLGKKGGGYKLLRKATNVIPAQDEFFFIQNSNITVNSKGVITVSYSTFSSAGSYTNNTRKLQYRYQNGDVYLIGVEDSGLNRATQATTVESTNFLTGKKKVKDGGKERWEKVGKKPLLKLGEEVE